VYIIKSFNRPEHNDDEKFAHLQSMILYRKSYSLLVERGYCRRPG